MQRLFTEKNEIAICENGSLKYRMIFPVEIVVEALDFHITLIAQKKIFEYKIVFVGEWSRYGTVFW